MLTVHHSVGQSTQDGRYSLSPSVILLAVDDGSARLLDLDGSFHALSETAVEMLQGALTHGIDATIAQLAARYRLAPERIRSDIEALLDGLLKQQLIERSGERSRRVRLRHLSALVAIGPMLRLLDLFGPSEQLTVVVLIAFARLCTAMFGWGPTVDAWRAAIRPKAALSPSRQDDTIQRIDSAIRATAAKIPSAACKERALACWYLLCSLRIPATLIVGVQLYPLAGHCWCQVGNQVLTDITRRCDTFVPIVRYEIGGDFAAGSN